jgi:hypothetical protein
MGGPSLPTTLRACYSALARCQADPIAQLHTSVARDNPLSPAYWWVRGCKHSSALHRAGHHSVLSPLIGSHGSGWVFLLPRVVAPGPTSSPRKSHQSHANPTWSGGWESSPSINSNPAATLDCLYQFTVPPPQRNTVTREEGKPSLTNQVFLADATPVSNL